MADSPSFLIDESAQDFSIQKSIRQILLSGSSRILTATSKIQYSVLSSVLLLPKVAALYPYLDTSKPSYNGFIASPSNGSKVQADIENFLSVGGGFQDWQHRAEAIRRTGNPAFCIGNLSVALSDVGSAYAASANGASTLLTLIPTAGALIGAPAKELWVLYKLMPIAGVLSMLLSLGGNIVPMDLNDYETVEQFSYAGMIPTADSKADGVAFQPVGETEAERFASQVYLRALDARGARRTLAIWGGIALQLFWLACILMACWFLGSGSIIVWWCTVRSTPYFVRNPHLHLLMIVGAQNSGWMFFWYTIVAVSSLIENLAGVPFSHDWTIRVSRAPKILISDDAPWIIPEFPDPPTQEMKSLNTNTNTNTNSDSNSNSNFNSGPTTPFKIPRKTLVREEEIELMPFDSLLSNTPSTHAYTSQNSQSFSELPTRFPPMYQAADILTGLERGYNTVGRVVMDPSKPWSASNDAFYVLLSIKGVTNSHAIFRVFTKFFSIGVFAIGTALFASSTLVTILGSVITASLILCAGIFGRVTAMWMASEMMMNKPVLHRVVRDREEAAKYMEAILRKQGIACEVLGHVLVNGRCVKKYSKKLRWSSFLGVLASPYDLSKLANNPNQWRVLS
jgi:hypothetical protein